MMKCGQRATKQGILSEILHHKESWVTIGRSFRQRDLVR